MKQNEMGDLLKRVSRMKKDMDRVQDELKGRYVDANVESEGKELIEVMFNGVQELVRLTIHPDAVERDADGNVDFDLLADFIAAAVNKGLEKSKKLQNDEMNEVSGGLMGQFPGFF